MWKKDRKSIYKQCLDFYTHNINTEVEEKDYKNVNDLYFKIKEYYMKKLKNKEFDINVERIRIETELGKYTSNYAQYVLNFLIATLAALIVLFLDKSNVFADISDKKLPVVFLNTCNYILKAIAFFIIIIFLIKTSDDDTLKRKKNESIINNIKLKVLDEIEKENNEANSNKIRKVWILKKVKK